MRPAADVLGELRRRLRAARRLGAPHARRHARATATRPQARGLRVLIAGAGGAAHLPGMLAVGHVAARHRRAGRARAPRRARLAALDRPDAPGRARSRRSRSTARRTRRCSRCASSLGRRRRARRARSTAHRARLAEEARGQDRGARRRRRDRARASARARRRRRARSSSPPTTSASATPRPMGVLEALAGRGRDLGGPARRPRRGHARPRRAAAGLDVGVHLALTAGLPRYRWGPVTFAPSLLGGDGGFPATVADLHDHADPDEVRRECRAQLERAVAVRHRPHPPVGARRRAVRRSPRSSTCSLELAEEQRLPLRLPDRARAARVRLPAARPRRRARRRRAPTPCATSSTLAVRGPRVVGRRAPRRRDRARRAPRRSTPTSCARSRPTPTERVADLDGLLAFGTLAAALARRRRPHPRRGRDSATSRGATPSPRVSLRGRRPRAWRSSASSRPPSPSCSPRAPGRSTSRSSASEPPTGARRGDRSRRSGGRAGVGLRRREAPWAFGSGLMHDLPGEGEQGAGPARGPA